MPSLCPDNHTLGTRYNTVEKLMAEPRMQRHIKYARSTKSMSKSEANLVLAR